MTEETSDNIKIELALLNQSIKNLTTTLVETNSDMRELKNELRKTLDDHEKRIREVETSQTKLSERMTLWQIGQAAFSTTIGGIVTLIKR